MYVCQFLRPSRGPIPIWRIRMLSFFRHHGEQSLHLEGRACGAEIHVHGPVGIGTGQTMLMSRSVSLLCREQARQAARTAPQLPGAARAAAARPSSAPPPRATVKLQDGSFAASSALTVHSTPTACSAPRSAPHGKARCSCAASCSSASRAGEPEGTTKCSNQRNDSSSMM
ncbi:unnamed protein product [Prorocentrum cordatum]|nr:unnamed protein product [Polarella glacialis]